jgi:hypothetical protein
METLSTRIPTVNVQSDLGNLNNFNLGTLIPPNKPFFSTLITNNIQYIILTEVVDVPISFFSNMATMVNGGTQLYTAKMNQFKTSIPQNPPTTILFYNENSQLLDNQNLVCNSNCDLVPSKKITPSIGTYTSTESEKKKEEKRKTISGSEIPPEKCEKKDVWVNQPTKPKPIKDPNQPDSSIPTLTDGRDPTVVVALTVSILIVLVVGTIVGFFKYTNKNKLSIIILVIGLVSLIVGLSVGCGIYTQYPQTYIISYIFGAIVWVISLFILAKYKDYDSNGYGFGYSSFNTAISPTTTNKQQYSSINVPTGFNQPKQSFFGKMFSSRSNDSKPTDYSPQITVPTAQNTQPKQSLFGKIFKKSPEQTTIASSEITVPTAQNTQQKQSFFSKMFKKNPESTVSVPSEITVPQSISPQQKQSFLSKINPFSKSSASPATQISPANLIKSKTKIIEDIQRTSMNQTKKNSLIRKINSSTNSNIVQRLNEAYKELNKLKSTP